MIQATDAAVLSALREVVAEKPAYVYEAPEHMTSGSLLSCFYVHVDEDGEFDRPGCLVGAVLNRLGIRLDALVQHEDRNAYQMLDDVIEISERARIGLSWAQEIQDDEGTWAHALEAAERAFSQ